MLSYRSLGHSGLQVSELCLGAMTFGREATKAESFALLDRFAEHGGNFIDTADVYSHGLSEEILGEWLSANNRDAFVIASKGRFAMGSGPNDIGTSRKHLLSSIENSLKRLRTDYVDLYQLHAWDPLTPLDETLGTLDTLVKNGKVRYLGASNFLGWQLQKAVDISRNRGWEPFICLQPQYNLLCRATEFELLPVCQREGIGVIPWSPLRGGWLSGKFYRGMIAPLKGSRIETAEKEHWGESWSNYANEKTWRVLDALHAVATRMGKTPAQVALNWLLQQTGVTAPIIGARNLQQLTDNLGSSGWHLGPEEIAILDDASAIDITYPYDRAAHDQRNSGRTLP